MATPTRILLIDDDAVDRQAVRRVLAASDLTWELVEAADGAEGLAQARARHFDCVLLDYRLPDIDAFDMLADLLSPEGGRNAVMMLTGERNPETALELMRAGALDHLAKGELSPEALARAIRYAKARRGFLSELEEKSAELDALNRQKALLLSIIAHDLRNPFQVILGMSDMLIRAVAQSDPAKVERRAHGIRDAAGQVHRLMEDLFTWAAAQMDSAEIQLENLAVADVAETTVAACRKLARDKDISLDVECEGVSVRSHREMLATILRNLVGNAIKFTPPGGRVTISAGGERAVTLRVADTGVGMSREVCDRLFRLDERMTTQGTAGETGGGLGLLLCRGLAEQLGSRLDVSSEPGQGTTFSLELPPASTRR